MTSAGGVIAARSRHHGTGGGANPTPALLRVVPIRAALLKPLLVEQHYLHASPTATRLAFGVLLEGRLLGGLTLGAGSANAHRLVTGATQTDTMTLTRLWFSDELPPNSESRVLGIVLRALRKQTRVKFLLSYADPAAGHFGIIYTAANFLYTGLCQPTAWHDLGDGVLRHNRSVSSLLGTQSASYLARAGIPITTTMLSGKHRFVFFFDPTWAVRLAVPILPHPKKEISHAGS
jgi:hypothetical protein